MAGPEEVAEELIIELIMELVKEAAMEELNVDDTVMVAFCIEVG